MECETDRDVSATQSPAGADILARQFEASVDAARTASLNQALQTPPRTGDDIA